MSDFDFLLNDIEQQRKLAKEALSKAREIDKLLKGGSVTDKNATNALEQSKNAFADIASKLTLNIKEITSTANDVLDSIKSR